MKTFYVVYRNSNCVSTKQYETVNEAQNECERLAAVHPGTKFFVLMALSVTEIELPRVHTKQLLGDQIDADPH